MDSIDGALTDAWNKLEPRVCADRVEALRRAMRRTRPLLTRPIRPWCLCLRADDRRLGMRACVPKYLPEERLPHEIVVFSSTIRELCKPVDIPWPGWDWERAAYALGRHPESLRSWIKRGVFQVSYRNAFSMGKRGKPVPEIWSHGLLDPNADLGRAPDPVWGTLWHYHWNSVPDGLEFALRRVPVGRRDPRDRASATRHVGWQFICPGLDPAASRPVSCDDEPVPPPPDTPSLRLFVSPSLPRCGRKADRLFLPLRPWTMLDALGGDDPLDISLPFPHSRGHSSSRSPCSLFAVRSSLSPSPPPPSLRLSVSPSLPPFLPACHHCHRIRYFSLVAKSGWNQFVAHLSAGLLHGHEVERPPGMTVERRRRYAAHRRRAPQRARVLNLLSRGLQSREIAARLGVREGTVVAHVKRLFRLHAVHSRADLCARLGLPYARPIPPRRAQVIRALFDGLTAPQIARRLGISAATVRGHCKRLHRIHNVHSRAQLLARLRGRAFTRPAITQDRASGPKTILPPSGEVASAGSSRR